MKIVGTLSQRIFFQVSPTKYFPINLIDLKNWHSLLLEQIFLYEWRISKKYFPFNKLFPFTNKNKMKHSFDLHLKVIFSKWSLCTLKKSAVGSCLNLSINILGKKLVFQSTCFNLICWKENLCPVRVSSKIVEKSKYFTNCSSPFLNFWISVYR